MKKALSLILCVIILGALAVPAFAAGAVKRMEAKYELPKAGEVYHDHLYVDTAEPEKYSAYTEGMWYFEGNEVITLLDGDIIPAGKTVYLRIRFTANEGYGIENYQNGGIYILNGKVIDEYYFETGLQARYNTDSPNLDGYEDAPKELNFFEKIAAFFADLFDHIKAFFGSLFPKV